MKISVILVAFLLAGCAHAPDQWNKLGAVAPPVHHVNRAKKAHKIVTPAPVAPPVAAPVAPETFKHRWLKKFFRERAS